MDLHCLQMCVRIYLMSEFTRLYTIASTQVKQCLIKKHKATNSSRAGVRMCTAVAFTLDFISQQKTVAALGLFFKEKEP